MQLRDFCLKAVITQNLEVYATRYSLYDLLSATDDIQVGVAYTSMWSQPNIKFSLWTVFTNNQRCSEPIANLFAHNVPKSQMKVCSVLLTQHLSMIRILTTRSHKMSTHFPRGKITSRILCYAYTIYTNINQLFVLTYMINTVIT